MKCPRLSAAAGGTIQNERKSLKANSRVTSPQKSIQKIFYSDFVNVILTEQLSQHLKFLEPLNTLFKQDIVDPDRDGVIDFHGLGSLLHLILSQVYQRLPTKAELSNAFDPLVV